MTKRPCFLLFEVNTGGLTGRLCCNSCRKWCAALTVDAAARGWRGAVTCWAWDWLMNVNTWNNPSLTLWGLLRWPSGKESTCQAGDVGLISGLGRSPGEGNGNPLQCSCMENPWTAEPDGLHSMGSKRVGHDFATRQQQVSLGWIEKAGQVLTFEQKPLNSQKGHDYVL